MQILYTLVLLASAIVESTTNGKSNNSIDSAYTSSAGGLAGHKVVSISGVTLDVVAELQLLDLDVWSRDTKQNILVAHVDEDQYDILTHMSDLKVTVINDQLDEQVMQSTRKMKAKRSRCGKEGCLLTTEWFTEYHPFEEIKAWYKSLSAKHQDIIKFVPCIGKSHQGREIFAIHVNFTPCRPGKKQVWVQGLIHAREWISGSVVQYISYKLAELGAKKGALDPSINDTEFIIVPVVNPDGYEFTWTGNRLWRKNMAPAMFGRGVDLNRNFDDHWGEGGASNIPVSDTYRGPSAASEPETLAIQNYFQKAGNIVGALDWHAYSQLILFPYGWTDKKIANYNSYRELTDLMATAFSSQNNRKYIPEQSSDLYPTSGSAIDWFVGKGASKNKYSPYSLTIELPPSATGGNGFLLDPGYIIPVGKESWDAFVEFVKYSVENATPIDYKKPSSIAAKLCQVKF